MQSDRLKYKQIEQGHLPLLFALYTDEIVRKYLGGVLTQDQAKARVEALLDSPPKRYWILQNEQGEDIGFISLSQYYDGVSTEVSYGLLPQYCGRGYAMEAIKYIAEWAFDVLQIEKLMAETQLANKASIKLLQKTGFEFVKQIVRFDHKQAIYQINLLDLRRKRT